MADQTPTSSFGSGTIVSDENEEEEENEDDDENDEEEGSEESDSSMSYEYDESYTKTITPPASQSRLFSSSSTRKSGSRPSSRRPSSMSYQTDSITTLPSATASTYPDDDDFDDDDDAGHHDVSADAYHNNHRQPKRSANNIRKESRLTNNSMSYSATGGSSQTSPADSRAYRSASAAVLRRMKPSTSSVSAKVAVDNNQQQQPTATKRTRSAHAVNMPNEIHRRKPRNASPSVAEVAPKQPNTTSGAHDGPAQARGGALNNNILPEAAQRKTFYDFMHFSGGVLKHDCTSEEFFLAGDYPQTWDELQDLLRNTQSRLEEDFCDRLQALVDELAARPELLRRSGDPPHSSSENEKPLQAASPELMQMFSQTAQDAVKYMHYQVSRIRCGFPCRISFKSNR